MELLICVAALFVGTILVGLVIVILQGLDNDPGIAVNDDWIAVVAKPNKPPRIISRPGWHKMKSGDEVVGKFCVKDQTRIPFKPFPTVDGFGIPVTANVTWLIPPERYLDHAANPGPELRDIISSAVSNFIARYKAVELLMGNHDELNVAFCAAVKDLAANYDYQVSAATITVENVSEEAAAACELAMGVVIQPTQPSTQPLPTTVTAKEAKTPIAEVPLPPKEVMPVVGIPVSIEPEDDDE